MKPFPVLLTFDLDGETAFEETHPGIPYWVTQGGYGLRESTAGSKTPASRCTPPR